MKKRPTDIITYIRYTVRFFQVFILLEIIQSALIFSTRPVLGGCLLALGIGVFGVSIFITRKLLLKVNHEISRKLHRISKMKQHMFSNSPMPVAILDEEGNISWYNDAFERLPIFKEAMPLNIKVAFPQLQVENLNEEPYFIPVSMDKYQYTMIVERSVLEIESHTEMLYVTYLIDQTETNNLRRIVRDQKCMVAYIGIDNFEEIIQSIDEVRRPILTAIIDRKLNLWFKDNNVVLSKFEKDKYIVVFTRELLTQMEERKFDILDEIRNIQVSSHLPVTISMGIGVNIASLEQAKDDARSAFDLALGRGGDQAVIKNKDKYTFYGGKTKEVEKSTRVKVRIKAYAFKELLHHADKVYIMGHKNIDMDCLGAAMGVYRAAALMGKKAQIILESPTFAIQSLYDRIIESKDYEDLFITPQEVEQQVNKDTLLVIVDVHRKSYLEYPEILNKIESVVIFDHHRKSTDFIEDPVLMYIEPFISSTCEIIAEILNYLADKVKLTPIEADALLAGITIDTKNFVFKTGVRTFEAAAFLRRSGADSTRVRMLFKDDLETYRARALAIREAEIWDENIAVSFINTQLPNSSIVAAQVADELLNVKGIEVSFVMAKVEESYSISARALTNVNVQRIMEILGGGGHQSVAGAQLKDVSLDQAKELLRDAINQYNKEGEQK